MSADAQKGSRIQANAVTATIRDRVYDEFHVHKTRDLIDAIQTGMSAKDQPLILFLTTADADCDGDETT